jgi:hypothetical protein
LLDLAGKLAKDKPSSLLRTKKLYNIGPPGFNPKNFVVSFFGIVGFFISKKVFSNKTA